MTTLGSGNNYRARLVDVLWRFKRSVEKDSDGQYTVNFNLLQNDKEYLDEVVEYGTNIGSDDTRTIIKELSSLRTNPGALTPGTKSFGEQKEHTATDEPLKSHIEDQPARVQTSTSGTFVRLRRYGVLAICLVLLAIAGFYYQHSAGATTVSGDINGQVRWHSGKTIILEGLVYVNSGVLTIEPGVTVKGKPGSALVVTKAARIHAVGTADQPIVFTSSAPVGERASGDWGGVVLLGNAPVNEPGARIEGVPETDSRGEFGGTNAENSCGVISYARIEFAGYEAYANNELNGLTLGGCGSSTVLNHIQVHRSLDDGIEFFGGSANMSHILITGAGDDSLDWDLGWRGKVQYLFIQMYAGRGDNAFEGDNNGSDFNAEPRSEPTLFNVTLASAIHGRDGHRGMVIREGSGLHLHNFIVEGFGKTAVDFRDIPAELVEKGLITVSNGLFSANKDGANPFDIEIGQADDDHGFFEDAYFKSRTDVQIFESRVLNSSFVTEQLPDPTPNSGYGSQLRKARPLPQMEFFNEQAVYMGAMEPSVRTSWFQDWAETPLN